MGIELIVAIFVSFIFTLCIYVLPIIAIRLKRPYSRKASHRIALWYSIGLTLFLTILRTAMGQQPGNNFWGFIFYFVNKSILHNGYNEDELKVDHTKGTSDSTQNKVNENIIEGSVNKETGGNVEQVKLNENIIEANCKMKSSTVARYKHHSRNLTIIKFKIHEKRSINDTIQ